MASLNITSLSKHVDELKIFLSTNSVDVLAINETRLDSSITDCEVFIPGYEIFRRDRNINGRHGGGVCFYVQNNINCIPHCDLNVMDLENLCIEIHKPHSKPFLVASWYRPLDSSVDKFDLFEGLVGRIDAEGLEYYIFGDMNVNVNSSNSGSNLCLLTDIADVYGLQQLINEPTRVSSLPSTMIDLIFTNCSARVVCSGVSHIGISGHRLIYVYRKIAVGLSNSRHSTVTYREFNFNSALFCNDISSQDWNSISQLNDLNTIWHAWNMFLNVTDKHAPIRTKRVSTLESPWIMPQLKQCMHKRDALEIKAICSSDSADWHAFKCCHNDVNNQIKHTELLKLPKNLLQENLKAPLLRR